MTVLVAFDTGIREFHGNRIFDPAVAAKYPGAMPAVRLHRGAEREGFSLITSDVYLRERKGERGLLLSDMHSRTAERLIRLGLVPAASVCAESPIVAYDFYHNLEKYSRNYPHVFYFRGMRERVTSPATQFHVHYFTQSRKEIMPGAPPWRERDFLVMVASNKRAFPRRKVHNLKDLRREWIRRRDPWMASDLYEERLRAIAHFSRYPDFHLYGFGWNEEADSGGGGEISRSLKRSCRGTTPDKLATVAGHKFSLCFENTRFPGYVTEKIFDCFFAGTIPVYLGAPDIEEFVPAGTFVDSSRFSAYDDLNEYLRGMSEGDAHRMIDRIRAFLGSPDFEKFHEESYARSMVDVFRSVAKAAGLHGL